MSQGVILKTFFTVKERISPEADAAVQGLECVWDMRTVMCNQKSPECLTDPLGRYQYCSRRKGHPGPHCCHYDGRGQPYIIWDDLSPEDRRRMGCKRV